MASLLLCVTSTSRRTTPLHPSSLARKPNVSNASSAAKPSATLTHRSQRPSSPSPGSLLPSPGSVSSAVPPHMLHAPSPSTRCTTWSAAVRLLVDTIGSGTSSLKLFEVPIGTLPFVSSRPPARLAHRPPERGEPAVRSHLGTSPTRHRVRLRSFSTWWFRPRPRRPLCRRRPRPSKGNLLLVIDSCTPTPHCPGTLQRLELHCRP